MSFFRWFFCWRKFWSCLWILVGVYMESILFRFQCVVGVFLDVMLQDFCVSQCFLFGVVYINFVGNELYGVVYIYENY